MKPKVNPIIRSDFRSLQIVKYYQIIPLKKIQPTLFDLLFPATLGSNGPSGFGENIET